MTDNDKTDKTEETIVERSVDDAEKENMMAVVGDSFTESAIATTVGTTSAPSVPSTWWSPSTPYSTRGVLSGTAITTTTSGKVMRTPRKVPVDAPSKRPKKILIAFLDDDDNQEWAAKLDPKSILVDMALDGFAELTINVDLCEDEAPK